MRNSFMATRYRYPVGLSSSLTRSHRPHTFRKASCINSSDSCLFLVTNMSAPKRRSFSASKNSSNVSDNEAREGLAASWSECEASSTLITPECLAGAFRSTPWRILPCDVDHARTVERNRPREHPSHEFGSSVPAADRRRGEEARMDSGTETVSLEPSPRV